MVCPGGTLPDSKTMQRLAGFLAEVEYREHGRLHAQVMIPMTYDQEQEEDTFMFDGTLESTDDDVFIALLEHVKHLETQVGALWLVWIATVLFGIFVAHAQ